MMGPGRELDPLDVLIDLLGSADFPAEVLDPEAAARIILQRLDDGVNFHAVASAKVCSALLQAIGLSVDQHEIVALTGK